MLADMAKDIQAARLLTWDAAQKLDAGEPATMACSMAKCMAGDVAVARTADAVQVFGGSGYIRGFEVERLYRDAKICQIYEGTNQIQRTHHRPRAAAAGGAGWLRESAARRLGFVRARPSPGRLGFVCAKFASGSFGRGRLPAAWVRSCKSSVGFVRATPDRGLGFGRAGEGDEAALLAGRVGHRTLRAGWAAMV